jgi:hypothetical protein
VHCGNGTTLIVAYDVERVLADIDTAVDRIVNVSQIKHLDGRYKPAATPQVGRG